MESKNAQSMFRWPHSGIIRCTESFKPEENPAPNCIITMCFSLHDLSWCSEHCTTARRSVEIVIFFLLFGVNVER